MQKKESTTPPWHTMDVEEVLAKLESHREGLSEEEARKRLAKYGKNDITPQKKLPPLFRRLVMFNDVSRIILSLAAIVLFILGNYLTAGILIGVIIVNTLVVWSLSTWHTRKDRAKPSQ